MDDHSQTWHRVSPKHVPDEGRARSVVVDHRSIAMTRCAGRLGALENHCPHQGGPLGEGSIDREGAAALPMARLRLRPRDQLDAAMAELFATDGPALLCVEQDSELH